jgi:cytochrome c
VALLGVQSSRKISNHKENIMKFRYLIALTAALSVSATCFAADDGEALFKKSGCTACHKLDGKAVGPSVKQVAAKYMGDNEAQARLEKKVRTGGAGSFGSMAMPPVQKSVSDETIKTIVTWALSQK